MRTCICACFDHGFKPVADLTLPILMEYCDGHGYSLRVEQNPVCEQVKNGNPIVWHRLDMIKRAMPFYDLVVWMDSDVLITNLAYRIEDMLLMHDGPRDLMICEDVHGLNDGVMIWGCSSASHNLVDMIHDNYKSDSPQAALQKLYDGDSQLAKRITGTILQKTMNAYLYEEYDMAHEAGQWERGRFILHLPGLPIERRVRILQEKIPMIVR